MASTAMGKKQARPWQISETVKNFWLDILLFFAFIIDMNTRFTGLAIHEWLGVALSVAFIYHLLWHWNWIVSVTRRIVSKLPPIQRFKYILDLALFIDMVIVIATGIWISEVVVNQVGLQFDPNFLWRRLHSMTADLAVLIVALHIALSWKWIVNAYKRYLWRPLTQLFRRHRPVTTEMERAQ